MYSIFVGGNSIYEDAVPDIGRKVSSPKLTLEDSNPGSLEFDLPPTNDVYDLITRYKDRVAVKRGDSFIWYGRVAGDTIGINGVRNIYCEGALAILNDTVQPRKKYDSAGNYSTVIENYISGVIDEHNAKVGSSRQFMFGGVMLGTEYDATSYEKANDTRWTCYEKTIDIFSSIREETVWHIIASYIAAYDKYIIYLFDDAYIALESATKNVDYRKNLIDISVEYDITKMASVVLPLGSAEQGDNDGDPEKPYLIPLSYLAGESNRRREYEGNQYYVYNHRVWCMYWKETSNPPGWHIIENEDVFENKISIDTSDMATDAEKCEAMYQAGILFLHEHRPENASYTIQAVDGYYAGVDTSHVDLYDRVNITYPVLRNGKAELEVLSEVPVLAMEIPLDSPGSTTYTLNKLPGEQISEMTSISTHGEITSLRTSVDGANSSIKDMFDIGSDVIRDVGLLATNVSSLSSQVTNLATDVNDLGGRMTRAETDIGTLTGLVSALDTRATNLETAVGNLVYAVGDNPSWSYISAHGFHWNYSSGDYRLYITVNLPKSIPSSLASASHIEIQTLIIYLRSSAGGYVQSSGYNLLLDQYVTVEYQSSWGDTIRLVCTKTNGHWKLQQSSTSLTDLPDNTIFDGMIGLKLKFK